MEDPFLTRPVLLTIALFAFSFCFRSKVYYLDWRRVMFEKLIFECAINLVGALHKCQSVGFIIK